MKNKIKQKKGISLIVLAITTIIMIILAAAVILSLNASDTISRAHKARFDNDMSSKREAANVLLAEYNLLVNTNDSSVRDKSEGQYILDKFIEKGIDLSNVAVVDGKIMIGSGASAINKQVAVGDYVKYVPTYKTSTTYKVYDTTNDEESDTYFATQMGSDALGWRYIGVDAEGNALLVADRSTDDSLYLYGSDGYVNGAERLNKLCNELYSSPLGNARSINLEDVRKVLGVTSTIGSYFSSVQNRWLNNDDGLTIGQLISQKGEPQLTNIPTPDVSKSINDYVPSYYILTGYGSNSIVFKDSFASNISYWLASPCVFANFYWRVYLFWSTLHI